MPYPDQPGFYPDAPDAYPDYDSLSGAQPPPPVQPPAPPMVAPSPPLLTVDAPMSSWLFGIGPAREGGITYELPQTTGRKFSVKLNESSEAAFAMDGRDPAALWIDELATDLHVLYRRSPADARVHLYRGRIGKASDKVDETGHVLSVPSLDYRGVLARRFLLTGSQQTWTQVDQTAIGWGLIQQTQNARGPDNTAATGGGSLGITDASSPTGKLRDRTYELEDEIAAKIQELSEVEDGFEWDILAPDPFRLEYTTWYPRRGMDRGVLLELGGAVRGLSRDVDSGDYANAVRLRGKAPDGGGAEPAVQQRYAPDLLTAPEGRWERVITTDITTDSGLSDRADWLLAEAGVVPVSYSFDMKRGWWQGPEHCWVGDPCLVKVYSGRLRVDTVLRVNQMDFTPDKDGGEAVQVTVGAPKPDPRRRTNAILRRLAELERR